MVGERRRAPKPQGAGIEKIGVFLSFCLTTKGFFLHQIILTLPRVAPFRGDLGGCPSAAPPLPLPPHLASPPLEHVSGRPARRRGRRRRDLSFPLKAPFWPGFCVDGSFVVLRRRAPGCLDSGLSCADPVPLCSDLSSPGAAAWCPRWWPPRGVVPHAPAAARQSGRQPGQRHITKGLLLWPDPRLW
jgi:hypothetical protein